MNVFTVIVWFWSELWSPVLFHEFDQITYRRPPGASDPNDCAPAP